MGKLGLALGVVAGILAVLGLAALGWGGLGPFLANPARAGLALASLLLTGAALFSQGNLSTGVKEDRSNRWVLVAFTVIGLLLCYLPALTDRLDVWTLGGEALRWAGLLVFTAGGVLRLWPVFVLGSRFSGFVAIQPGHRLVTEGPYRRIRHPSYLGLLVAAAGWSLVFRSAVGLLLTAALLVPLVARIRAEERLLAATFGAAWQSYAARTSRLLPGLW